MPPDLLLVNAALGRRFAVSSFVGYEVPLVNDDDHRAPTLVGVASDGGITGGYAFGRIDHHQRNVGSFEVLACHHHGKLLRHELGFTFAADSGGVDEAVAMAVVFDHFVHGIARGTRDGGNDRA